MPANLNPDPGRPPFTLGEGSPAEIGAQIAKVYEGYDDHPPRVADVWQAAAEAVALRAGSALFGAGHDLSVAMDSGVGNGLVDGYHNTRHYLEVVLNATHLMLRNNAMNSNGITLNAEERGMVLFAALAHDFHYEMGGGADEGAEAEPYFREHISFSEAKAYLERHGVAQKAVDDIGVMIYTTDVGSSSHAGAFLWAAHHHLFEGGERPAVTEVLERVRALLTDARLARMAALIRDSDILSSAGLTSGYLKHQNIKLAAELGRPREAQDTLAFLKNVVRDRFTTEAARFFQPNLEEFKRAAEAEAQAQS